MEFLDRMRTRAEKRRVGTYLGEALKKGVCLLQHDFDVANGSGSAVRGDVNDALEALATNSSGATAPSTTYRDQFWMDTTAGVWKKRNAANSGWIVVATIDETHVLSRSSNTMLDVSDIGKVIRATSTFTQTFDAVATLTDKWYVDYINEGSGVITFDPNSTETIAGATTAQLGAGESCRIVCNGSNLQIIFHSQQSITACEGRLSLTTAVPVTTSDVTGATTVYFVPYQGNKISLYDGTRWVTRTFSELSQATTDNSKSPAAVAASKVYDLFVWDDAGTLRCTRGPLWDSDTSRGTGAGKSELELLNGRYVNKVAITNGPAAQRGLYVGTIRSDGSSQINDSLTLRYVWNNYNRLKRPMLRQDTTDSWTYSTATTRQANNSASNQLDFVLGLSEDPVFAEVLATWTSTDAGGRTFSNIGLDSTSANSAKVSMSGDSMVANDIHHNHSSFEAHVAIGRHFLAWLEKGGTGGTVTWHGDNGGTDWQSGIFGSVWG